VINGGITQREQIDAQLTQVDGVMLGRAAYHDPWLLADPGKTRAAVVERMVEYARRQLDVPLRAIARHMLGLYHGLPRARLWRACSRRRRLKQNRPSSCSMRSKRSKAPNRWLSGVSWRPYEREPEDRQHPTLRDRVSKEEWQMRVDLAAAYQLAAIYKWTDLIYTHFSARVPGTEDFLLNPYG